MPAKSSSRDKNKKLSDFFPQNSFASIPPLATSSSPTGTTTATSISMTRTRRLAMVRASKSTTGRESSLSSSTLPQMHSSSVMSARKRTRSPDSNSASLLPPSKLRSPKKPMKIFQQSASERPKAIVYITSPPPPRKSLPQRSTPVRMHNKALVVSPSDSSKEIVCSSQSDEAELALPISESRDVREVVENVHAWRRKASKSSVPHSYEDAMEVDPLPPSPISSSSSASTSSTSPLFDPTVCSAVTSGSGVALRCFSSLPDTDELLPLPPTPEPIDPEAKAAKLIAEIRAKAFAVDQFSDDEQPLAFRELEDSDDDDLIDDLPLIGGARGQSVFSSPLSSVPSTFNDAASLFTRSTLGHDSPPLRLPRASVRTRKPAPAFHLPPTIADSSTSVGTTKLFSSNCKTPRTINPLRALLREKELEDRRGTSCIALRLAEEAVRQGSREVSVSSDDELNTVSRLRLADEQAAWKAVHEYRMSTSPASPRNAKDVIIGDRESKMLGTAAGEAINKILASDKDGKGKERAQITDHKGTLGVSLWIQSSDEDIEVDPVAIPPLTGHPVLTRLDSFLRSGDHLLLDLILRSGALTAVPGDILLSNIPRLLDMALFACSQVADAVFIALRDLCGFNPPKAQIPFAAILLALVRLGASPSVLEGFGLITKDAQEKCVTHETLPKTLKRFLAIVKTAAFAGAFFSDDVANVVLILVIIGLDPLTSSELHTQVNITIDVVCNHGATDCLLHDVHEKVLSFARPMTSANKARLVSFFASGSGRTRCIARRLAYCLLVSASITTSDQAPPLEPLILLLSPDAGSCELFDLTNESMDYEELRHHVNILSVALIDIAPYVEEERTITKSASNTSMQGSPNKSKKPTVPPLELLRGALEILQSKIVDTRAAHLDRSRTKAVIQRLTMRVYYDRMALLGVRPRRRASTLKTYFSPQRQ